MSEIKRILTSSRTILCFCVCLFLSYMFFAYECGIEKYVTAEGEELTAYLDSYAAFLDSVQEKAQGFGKISSMQGGFPGSNIAKTVDDYAALHDTVLMAGENRGIVLFSNYFTADLILVALVVMVAAGFSEENKKKLGYLVRSTRYGRRHLSAQRVVSLVTVSLLFSFALCLGCMLIGFLSFGSPELLRPIQSIPEFKLCSMSVSIVEYLLISCLVKALAASVIGFVLYLFSARYDSGPAAIIVSGLVAVQYISYTFIASADRMATLKFCNIIALLRADVFFKNYLNLNFFGKAFGFFDGAVLVLGVLFVFFAVLCIAYTSGRTEGHNIGKKTIEKIRCFFSKREPSKGLVLWEMKKVFIGQKGLLVLVGVLYIAFFSSVQYQYVYTPDSLLELYYKKYAGEISAEKTEAIRTELIFFENRYQELIAGYEQAEITGDAEKAGELFMDLLEVRDHFEALQKIETQAVSGLEYSQKSGRAVELIKADAYELLYVRDSGTTERNCMYILFAVIGMFSGILARERQTNVLALQRSSKRGRRDLLVSKLIILFLSCILISVAVNAVQTLQLGSTVGYNDLGAPAQSLEFLRGCSLPVTIGQYMVLIFILRALGAFAIGLVVMLISRYSKNTMTALSISAAILIIPSLLDSFGVSWVVSAVDLLKISVLK